MAVSRRAAIEEAPSTSPMTSSVAARASSTKSCSHGQSLRARSGTERLEVEIRNGSMRACRAHHQRSERIAGASETLSTLPEPPPGRGRIREQRAMAIKVAALKEQPGLLGCVHPDEE